MKLNNTIEKQKIIKRSVPLKKIIAGGLIVFSLGAITFSIDQSEPKILDSEEYGFYSTQYLENLRTTNLEDFDSKFAEIYDNVTFSYNGNLYPGSSIYIIAYDNGTVHLESSDRRRYDLLTNEYITAERTKLIPFKESSVFYELYAAGIIQSEKVELSPNYSEIINKWDGKKHYQTVDLVVEQKTDMEYQEKYGGK